MKPSNLAALFILSASFTVSAEIHVNPTTPSEITAANHALNEFEKYMVDKVWHTTEALDQKGETVASTNPEVSNYFGIAEYFANGTFKMLTLEGKPKMQGEWSMSLDGKTRTLVAKDTDGKVLFTRTVENIKVTPEEYTYRIYSNADDKSQYYDIVHKLAQ